MATVTIAVDPETLKRAESKATEQGTSVDRVLGEYLVEDAGETVNSRATENAAQPDASVAPGDAPQRSSFVFEPMDEEKRQRLVEVVKRHVAMAKEAGARSGGITWTREDLYDRSDHDWSDS